MLSEKTAEVLRQFFLQRGKFEQTVASMNPKDLAEVLSEVLRLYANDKNSSTLREWVVLQVAGCQHRPDKIGYNGYRGDVSSALKAR